jgi:hypothetical protein
LIGLGAILRLPGSQTRVWIHLARDLTPVEGGRSPEADEVIEVERIPFSDAVAMAANGDIVDAKTAVALFRAAFRIGTNTSAD